MTSLMQPSSTAEASRTTASKVMPEKATVYNDKHSVLGVGISAVDYDTAVARIVDAGRKRQSMIVTALAVHGVMTGALDRQHNYRLNKFDMVCPDGQPVRWALNLLYGLGLKDRVYGPNLMLKVCEECEREGFGGVLVGRHGGNDPAVDPSDVGKVPAFTDRRSQGEPISKDH